MAVIIADAQASRHRHFTFAITLWAHVLNNDFSHTDFRRVLFFTAVFQRGHLVTLLCVLLFLTRILVTVDGACVRWKKKLCQLLHK